MTPLPNIDNTSNVSQNMENQLITDTDVTGDIPSNNLINSNTHADLNLHSETDRLKTYHNWPIPFINKQDLAAAGFYYTNRGDIVKCPYCEIEVGYWAENDSPDFDHERHSPQCRYVLWKKLRNSQNAPSANTVPNHPKDNQSRLLAGEDTCGPYGIEGISTRPPVLETEEISRDNMFRKLTVNSTDEPIEEEHVEYADRIKTYARWPNHSKLTAEALCEAGFFYTGELDRTKCFHCGGTLHNWNDFDEPWTEHAYWFPNCKYILIMKGQKFIDDARVKRVEDLARVQDEIKSALNTLKENVSTVHVNSTNPKDKVKESSSEGTSRESSVSEDAVEPLLKNDRESRLSCVICLEQERDSVLLPCYHMVACFKCAYKLTKCCVCREPVASRQRVYIS